MFGFSKIANPVFTDPYRVAVSPAAPVDCSKKTATAGAFSATVTNPTDNIWRDEDFTPVLEETPEVILIDNA